jgi:hypothetical protein
MLLLISQGCHELKPVFKEYAQWFKGKHQLVWSAGLRLVLLGNNEERADEELAQEEENDVVLLGQLTATQWSVILAHDARGRLLEIARSGDWQEVLAFLTSIGNRYGLSPPLLGEELPN